MPAARSPQRVSWAFVERVDDVEHGLGTLAQRRHLAVIGPRGVGRTRFAEHLAERADFTRTIRMQASPALGAVPLGALGPLTDPLHAHESGAIANDAVPRATRSVLRRCRNDSTLIVIDDATDLDPLSIEVIQAVCASTSGDITVLITVDADTTAPHRLADLWASGTFDVIQLDDVAPSRFEHLLRAGAGIECTQDDALRLHRLTGGRILLAHELVAASNGDCSPSALDAAFGSLRVQSAVARLLRTDEPEARLLLDLLAVHADLAWDLVYPAWNESVIAGLERSGAITSHGTSLSITIPAVARTLAAAVSERRRQALVRRVTGAQRDPANLPGPALVQLALLDAGSHLDLHPGVGVAAVRRALDLDDAIAARTIFESIPSRWAPTIGDPTLLDCLLAEVEAAEGRHDRAVARLSTLWTAEGRRSDNQIIARSVTDIMRRRHDADRMGALIDLVGASTDRAVRSRVDLQRADRCWERGHIAACATLIRNLRAESLNRNDRAMLSDLRFKVAVQQLDGAAVSAPRTARSSLEVRVLAQLLESPFDSTPPATESGLIAHALGTALVGHLDAAIKEARRIRRSGRSRSTYADRLLRALSTKQAATPSSADIGEDLGGLWGPWVELIDAWRCRWAAGDDDRGAALRELAARQEDRGALATSWIARHLAVLGSDTLWTPPDAPPGNSRLGRALWSHARCTASRDAVELTDCGHEFRSLGWDLSAAWSFFQAAQSFSASGNERDWFVALMASLHHRRRVDLRVAPPAHGPGMLTAREARIVDAIVAGVRSKDIAAADEVSVRTVDNQVYRLCHRLGFSSRGELVAAAREASGSTAVPSPT